MYASGMEVPADVEKRILEATNPGGLHPSLAASLYHTDTLLAPYYRDSVI